MNAPTPEGPRLLDRVRLAIRALHYSRRTEDAYVFWIRRFLAFHGMRHPDLLGSAHVGQFLFKPASGADHKRQPPAQGHGFGDFDCGPLSASGRKLRNDLQNDRPRVSI